MAEMNFLVFGAGFSARAAMDAIKRRNPRAEIAGTTRSAEKAEALSARGFQAQIFGGALSESLAETIGKASHILISAGPEAEGDPVLRACRNSLEQAENLQWLGYYSTIGVYGDAAGAWIDEDYPTQISNARIGWRIKAEADWQALAAGSNIPLAIMRLAGIYGSGRSGFDKLRNGTARRIIKEGQVFNRIHAHDIGEITARAAERSLGGIFNITDDEPAPPQDVTAFAASLIGVAPPPEIDFETADLSPMARSFYSGNRRVQNARIKQALGYELAYPTYREGLKAILEDERGR